MADTEARNDMIDQFIGVTGAAREFASSFLEAADWNLNQALDMYLGGGGAQAATMVTGSSNTNTAEDEATNAMITQEQRENEARYEQLRQRAQAIMEEQGVDQATAMAIAEAQGDPSAVDDNVRAPIAATTTRLIDEPMHSPFASLPLGFGGRGGLQAFRDFETEAQDMEERMLRAAGLPRAMMSGFRRGSEDQDVEEEMAERFGARRQQAPVEPAPVQQPGARNLQDLFSPPREILFDGSWDQARDCAKECNRWLLVNIQKDSEFMSYNLNRDLWCNEIIKDLIQTSFIFFQHEENDMEAARYKTYYRPETFPHVAIIDPFTGEQMLTFDLSRFQLNPEDLLANFLEITNRFLEDNHLEGEKIKRMQEKLQERYRREAVARAAQSAATSANHSVQDNRRQHVEHINHVNFDNRHADDEDVEILDQLEGEDQDVMTDEMEELAPEPEKSGDTTQIQFKLFDGKTVKRRFLKEQTVKELFTFVKHEVAEARRKDFDLVCFPQKSLKGLQGDTLAHHNLINTALRAVYN